MAAIATPAGSMSNTHVGSSRKKWMAPPIPRAQDTVVGRLMERLRGAVACHGKARACTTLRIWFAEVTVSGALAASARRSADPSRNAAVQSDAAG